MAKHVNYAGNVFINCPFDSTYKSIFEALVFAIFDCGFIARCALEEDNGTDTRISKIFNVIDGCKYGIHDISKADLDTATGLARFNMPLELGIFLGAQHYASSINYNKEKKVLIMDVEPYRYRAFVSDISGQDIRAHGHDVKHAISHIVNFLETNSGRTTIPGPTYIYTRYQRFQEALGSMCLVNHKDREALTFIAYSTFIRAWITENKY